MSRGYGYIGVILAILAGAMALRVVRLDQRPMHTDEAVHAVKLGELLGAGGYEYDPYEYHGPTLNYLTAPIAWLRGQGGFAELDEVTLRLVAALAGVGALAAMMLLGRGLGWGAVAMGVLLGAISPAMVFYSRYYIQEMLLVCFAGVVLGAGWRYVRRPGVGWALVAGVGVGLMHATKETAVLNWFAFAVAGAVVWGGSREGRRRRGVERAPAASRRASFGGDGRGRRDGRAPAASRRASFGGDGRGRGGGRAPAASRRAFFGGDGRGRGGWWHLGLGIVAAGVVSAVFFSSFGGNWEGIVDSFRTYGTYLERGAGEHAAHLHPWYWYLELLGYWREGPGPWWSEGILVMLGLVGMAAAAAGRGLGEASRGLVRFLAVYAVVLVVGYSAIPYKTPWCVLNFLWPMLLLAGVGAAVVWRAVRSLPGRVAVAIVLGAGVAHLGRMALLTNFRYEADERNPWVYAHTSRDVLRLAERAEQLAGVAAAGEGMTIKVVAAPTNYWPLPWYFRGFANTGFYAEVPGELTADMVVAGPGQAAVVKQALGEGYFEEFRGLRPGVLVRVYIRQGLWDAFIEGMAAGESEVNGIMDEPRDAAVRWEELGELEGVQRFSHEAMDTTWEILAVNVDERLAKGASQEAFALLDMLEGRMSRFIEGSDVWQINHLGAGESAPVGLDVLDCLLAAERMFEETGGAFDVTAGAVIQLWKEVGRSGGEPGREEIDAALVRSGMELLAIGEAEQRVGVRAAGVQVDLGGIGKGYALDRMAAVLREWEVDQALVHGGYSTVLALDGPAGLEGWPVALRHPGEPERVLGRVWLVRGAVAASGVAARGRHIVDPRTGEAVGGRLRAWSAAADGTTADALSTALMVMGAGEIEAYCEGHEGVGALVLGEDGSVVRCGRLEE